MQSKHKKFSLLILILILASFFIYNFNKKEKNKDREVEKLFRKSELTVSINSQEIPVYIAPPIPSEGGYVHYTYIKEGENFIPLKISYKNSNELFNLNLDQKTLFSYVA